MRNKQKLEPAVHIVFEKMFCFFLRMSDTHDYIDTAWTDSDLTKKSHYMVFDFDYVTEVDGFQLSVGDGGYITSFSVPLSKMLIFFFIKKKVEKKYFFLVCASAIFLKSEGRQ